MRMLRRVLQRLLIFGLGILTVWLIVFVVFRVTDRQLPWILAVSVTYALAAYGILPWVVRMNLKILQRKSEVSQAALQVRELEVAIRQDVPAAAARVTEAREWLRTYQTQVLPDLQKSLDDMERLLQQGQVGVDALKVLDVRRNLLRARDGYLDALLTYTQALADLAEQVNLSTTPCWRRIKSLEEKGVITRRVALLDPEKMNVGLTVFIAIRTNQHSLDWLTRFQRAIDGLPEIVEVYRMSGQIDYLLRAVVPDIAAYDAVYKRIIQRIELSDVTSMMAMEVIKSTTVLPVTYAE